MINKTQTLKACELFEDLSASEHSKFAAACQEKTYKRGETIFQEGDRAGSVVIVSGGQVKAMRYTSEGMELIVEIFGKCDIMGVIAVFANEPHAHTAVAMTDVETLIIRKDDFIELIGGNKETSMKVLKYLGQRIRNLQEKVQDFISDKVEQRIAKLLITLTKRMGKEIPFTRQEVAAMVGTSIETAIRVTSRFKEAGILKSSRGKIFVTNLEKLGIIAEGPPVKF